MTITMTSQMMDHSGSPNGPKADLALQKYLLLQTQLDDLRLHMYELCPSYDCATSTAVTSPSVSPTRTFSTSPFQSNHSSPARSRNHRRSSMPSATKSGGYCLSSSLTAVLDEDLLEEMATDEQKLCDVNEAIKRALTELLNSEAVRKDRAMRTWVQTRLMDTERELRTGRRRRSNGSTD